MNRLPKNKQIQIITALVEGCSIRSIERMYDVHRDTVSRLMVRTGMNCMTIMDDLMQDKSATERGVFHVPFGAPFLSWGSGTRGSTRWSPHRPLTARGVHLKERWGET